MHVLVSCHTLYNTAKSLISLSHSTIFFFFKEIIIIIKGAKMAGPKVRDSTAALFRLIV